MVEELNDQDQERKAKVAPTKSQGIKSFLKDDMERAGVEYSEEKADKVISSYDNNLDSIINDAGKRAKIKDVDAFRSKIYEHYELQKPEEVEKIDTSIVTNKKQKSNPPALVDSSLDELADKDGNYFGALGNSLTKGAAAVNQGIARIPSTIYRIAALPQNLLSNIPGLESLAVSKSKNSDLLNFLDDNKITEYYDKSVAEYGSKLKEYEKSAMDQWSSGDKIGALKTIGVQAVESIPLTALLMLSGGSGSIAEAGVGIGAFATGQKLHELDSRNPDMNEALKTINSMATGAFEAGSEMMTAGSIGIGKKLLAKKGVGDLKNVIQNAFKSSLGVKLGAIYSIASPMLQEGLTEGASQYAENYVDMVTGVKEDSNLMDGVFDSVLIGSVAGGIMSGPVSTFSEVVEKPELRRKIKKEFTKSEASLNDIAHDDYVNAVKNIIGNYSSTEQIQRDFEEVNDHYSNDVGFESRISARNYIVSSINYVNSSHAISKAFKEKVEANTGNDGKVTLASVDGEMYSVRNPQDLGKGNESKLIFVRSENGEVKPIISSRITQWKSKNPEDVVSEQVSNQDTQDQAIEQQDQIEQEAIDKGLIAGRTVETPNGKKKFVSIDVNGTAIVENSKGEQESVNIAEIEAYKTKDQIEAEKVQVEADPLMEGIEEGTDVVSDEPLTEGSETRIVDFSNGQSKIITPEGERVFNTPEERDVAIGELASGQIESNQEDIDNLPPDQAFDLMRKDDPEIANEIFQGEIDDLRTQAEESRGQVKESKSRKEKQTLLLQAKQLEAEAQRLDAILQDPTLLDKKEEVKEEEVKEEAKEEPVAESTPEQVLNEANVLVDEYAQEQEMSPKNRLLPWQTELMGSKINEQSFVDGASIADVTPQIRKAWFTKKGKGTNINDIDIVASEVSNDADAEITPQEIIDFIIQNPTRKVSNTTDRAKEIEREYKDLTGRTIKTHGKLAEKLGVKPKVEEQAEVEGFEKPTDEVPFKVVEPQIKGISITDKAKIDLEVKKRIEPTLNEMQDKFGIPIEVIHSTEIPEHVKAQAEGKQIEAVGFYDPSTGKAYIISDKVQRIADLKKTFMHEAVLHKGLDVLFESGPVTLLGKIYDTKNDLLEDAFKRMDVQTIADRAKDYGKDFFDQFFEVKDGKYILKEGANLDSLSINIKLELAEEALATLNETESPRLQVMLDKLYNYIKKTFGFTSKQFTKADLRNLLREHRDLIIKNKQDAESLVKANESTNKGGIVKEESGTESDDDSKTQEKVKFKATPSAVNENLVVLHNLNEANIVNIDKVGGLPVPSLAIVKTDIPFTAFGDISLIADKSMVDPQGYGNARTFNADVYSPRYPNISYDINYGKFDKAFGKANDVAKSYGMNPISIGSLDLENNGLRSLEGRETPMLAYLIENDNAPKSKMKDANIDEPLRKFIKKGYVDTNALVADQKFIDAVTEMYANDEIKSRFVKDGKINESILYDKAAGVARVDALKIPDTSANEINIRNRAVGTKAKKEAFDKWLDDTWRSTVNKEQIFKGYTPSGSRKYMAHTLDNVVKELTKGLQGAEGTFYGVGSVRSGAAKEFKSIKDIQGSRENIVSKEAFEPLKEEVAEEFNNILEIIKPYYKWDTEGWSYSSNAGESLTDYVKKGRSADFKAFPKDVKQEVGDFLSKLKNMPTEYFESKVQRAVGLNEFKAAVVPNNVSKEVTAILEKNGVAIKKYNPKTEGDRTKKVDLAAKQQKVKFRVAESQQELDKLPTVYHGSDVNIDKFDLDKVKGSGKASRNKSGIFFTSDPDFAQSWGENMNERKLDLKNPLTVESVDPAIKEIFGEKGFSGNIKAITNKRADALKEAGYDGVIAFERWTDYKNNERKKSDVYLTFGTEGILKPGEDVKFRTESIISDEINRLTKAKDEPGMIKVSKDIHDGVWNQVYENEYRNKRRYELDKPKYNKSEIKNIWRRDQDSPGWEMSSIHTPDEDVEIPTNGIFAVEYDGEVDDILNAPDSDIITAASNKYTAYYESEEEAFQADDGTSIRPNKLLAVWDNVNEKLIVNNIINDLKNTVDEERSKVEENPTEAQKEAGNYAMGHIKIDGFDISIENPKGSIRAGVNDDGEKWSNVMPADYGYFKGTIGNDKDHIDTFMGDNLESDKVYVVDQINPDGSFDEHKVMMGYNSLSEARNAYNEAYDADWKGLGAITRTTKDGLKEWFKGNTKKPFAPEAEIKFRASSTNPEVQKLLDKLQAVENLGRVATKTKQLEEDRITSMSLKEREDITKKIEAIKEGAKLGGADVKAMIKDVQKAITDYAKKTLPLTEAGAREIGPILTLIKDAQTPEAIEKAFAKIDELAGRASDKSERKKHITKVNRILKWMTGLKKSGTKRVGKFNYEETKVFQELKKVNDETMKLVKKTNSWKASVEDKAEAQEGLEKLWNDLDQKEDRNDLDNTMMKLIELRRLGSKASSKLAQLVSEELEAIYLQAKDAKNETDMLQNMEHKADRDAVKSFLENNTSLKKLPWAKRAITKINSGVADIMGNWETLMTMVGGTELRDKMSFILSEADATTGKQETNNRLLDKAKEIYNVDSKTGTLNKIHELSTMEYELVQPNRKGKVGSGDPMELSKLHLMDIYNATKNEDVRNDYYMSYGEITLNEDGSRDIEAQMADGKATIDALMENLSEEDKSFANTMQEELDKYYDRMNEIHIKLYNRDLPRVENYWPSTAEREQDLDIMDQSFADSRHPSASKERMAHRVPMPKDAFNKFTKHVDEAEWYSNMGLPVLEANKLFKDNNIKKLIEDTRGENFYANIKEGLQNVTLSPPGSMQQKSKLNSMLSPLLNNWVSSKIGATPSVPLKQLLSAVNYSENMPIEKWVAGFVKGMASPKETWKQMMEIPYLRARLGDGYSEAVQRALNGDENIHRSKVSNYHTAFKNLMTIGTRYGDITAIVFGGKPYLDYLLKQEGITEKEAVDKFLLDTLRSQQAPFASTLSKLQNSKNPFFRAIFAFSNTPSQYMRKMFEANQNLRIQKKQLKSGKITQEEYNKARKQTIKAHSIYGVINTVSFTMVGSLIGAFMKGSDADDEIWKDMLNQLGQVYIGGLPVIKDLIGGATRGILGMPIYDSSQPFIEGIDEIVTEGIKISKGDSKDLTKSYEKVGQGVATMLGVPYYNIKKDIKAIPPFRAETFKATRSKETERKLNKLVKDDDRRLSYEASQIKSAYSKAKRKAKELNEEGKRTSAKRIEDLVSKSKAHLWQTKYTMDDIKVELKYFNRKIDRIE